MTELVLWSLITLLLSIILGWQIWTYLSALLARVEGLRQRFEHTPQPIYDQRIHVFVPVKGSSPDTEASLLSLASQQAVTYKVIMITESEDDPAVKAIRQLRASLPHVHHVVAGQATHRGQKNHNLLAGIAAHPNADFYVTADADIRPHSHWLVSLIQPMLRDPAVDLTTTHHWMHVPPKSGLATTAFSTIHAYLHTLASQRSVVTVWGGSTGIRKTSFDRLQIAEAWENTVVDDVVLSALATRKRAKRVYLAGELIDSYTKGISLGGLWRWFLRQVEFQRRYSPGTWLFLLIVHLIILTAILAVIPLGLLAAFSLLPWWWFISAAGFSIMQGVLIGTLRQHQPSAVQPRWRWLLGGLLMVFVGTGNLIAAAFTQNILWSGKRYHLTRKGTVSRVETL